MKKSWKGCCAALLALCMGLCGPGGILASAAEVLPQEIADSSIQAVDSRSGSLNLTDVDGTGRLIRISYTGAHLSGEGSMMVAVWSDHNGQDDLEWITMSADGTGGYYTYLDISRHGEVTGAYHSDIYWRTSSGEMQFQEGVSCVVENIQHTSALLFALPDAMEQTASISALDYTMPVDGSYLKAAVWSEKDGQSDLEWLDLNQDGNNYTVSCNLLAHASSGYYNVHFYLQRSDGSMEWVGAAGFTVVGSTFSSITVENQDNDQGTCQIRMTGISSPTGIEQVQVAVWSKSDQSNLYWYTASSAGDGVYLADFNLANHQYDLGTYAMHVYIRTGSGLMEFKGDTAVSFTAVQAAVTAQIHGTSCTLRAENLMVPGGLKEVRFAVWSEENGQDDLRWTTASYQSSDHSASCTIFLDDYSGYGTYAVHVYGINAADQTVFLCNTAFTLAQPQVNAIEVVTDRTDGSFRIVVTGLENSGVQKVRIPVWSQADQSDIVWYDAQEQSDGSYQVVSSIAHHNYHIGDYTAHIYVTDQRGEESGVAGTVFTFSASAGEIIIGRDASEKSFPIEVQDVQVPAGAARVTAAVWSDTNGQDDMYWYDLTGGSNTYRGTIEIQNHRTLGNYNVHVYAQTQGGDMVFLGSSGQLQVTGTVQALVEISQVDENAGTFQVTVRPGQSNSGIGSILIPAWCAADQSDIVWYDAQAQSDGSYTATVNVRNHKAHLGIYQIHVYVTMGNGIQVLAGNTAYTFEPEGFFCILNDSGTGTRRALLQNAPAGTTQVQFPTWSDANGQDDIVWYTATQNAEGDWEAIIRSENHRDSGSFTTHCYINGQAYKGCQFDFPDGEFGTLGDRMVRQYARELIQQTGGDLYQLYRWAVDNITYQQLDVPMDYPDGYTRQQYYFVYAYENRRGNCFCYAATFYWAAKELGYDVTLLEGRGGMAAGGIGPHSWVEIRINGTTYICDPDAEYETGRNAYMVTYSSSPFTYYPNLPAY